MYFLLLYCSAQTKTYVTFAQARPSSFACPCPVLLLLAWKITLNNSNSDSNDNNHHCYIDIGPIGCTYRNEKKKPNIYDV